MVDKYNYNLWSSVPKIFFLLFSIKVSYFFVRKIICPTFALAKNGTDSVAQLVEHIPFKDGVLGSNPSWITKHTMLRQEHFLFDEGDETSVSNSRRKTKNEKSWRSQDGIVCFVGISSRGIMPKA
jgi:hypothetical protein